MANQPEQTDKIKPSHDSGHGAQTSELAVGNKEQLNQAKTALDRGNSVSPEALNQFPAPTIHDDTADGSKQSNISAEMERSADGQIDASGERFLSALVIPELVKDIATVVGGIVGLIQLGQMGWEALQEPMAQLGKAVGDMVNAMGNPDNVGANLEKLNPPPGQYPRFVVERDKEGHVTSISFAADKEHVFELWPKPGTQHENKDTPPQSGYRQHYPAPPPPPPPPPDSPPSRSDSGS